MDGCVPSGVLDREGDWKCRGANRRAAGEESFMMRVVVDFYDRWHFIGWIQK